MFTGIIKEIGIVKSVVSTSNGMEIGIGCPDTLKESSIGDSIAINGVCLTVKAIKEGIGFFDVSTETIKMTTTQYLKIGQKVNVEPAMRLDNRLGGHLVSGHVEDIGRILTKQKLGNSEKINISASEKIMQYVVKKGSMAVDGISLTVVDVEGQAFSVVIIPHTSQMTTLGFKNAGDMVNLEPDMIAKYVFHYFMKYAKQGTKSNNFLETLQKGGYI